MPEFDHFVIFAEMRTGSNFLEANLNAFDGLICHGEAFNPHFIGYPDRDDLLGITRAQRESDPARLIAAIRSGEGLGGFRFFSDHDPRALDLCLPDPRCAKIILTRNPLESYVSWKIAQATGQWKLTNAKHARSEQAVFDPREFEAHLERTQAFQVTLLNGLQRSGQTAFYIAYEDLQDLEVMNGLAAWLGCKSRLETLDRKLKKQNPEPLPDKVSNAEAMEAALARLDRFNLSRTPNFEPRRGPVIPTYVAAARSPLLYLPIRSGPEAAVRQWLADLDGTSAGQLRTDFTQKTLRTWKRDHPGHRSFTVLRHPLARAHAAFCDKILPTGAGTFPEIRATLRRVFDLPVPEGEPGADYGPAEHRRAFAAFLQILKSNLAGQTSFRIDPSWASQAALVQGFSAFAAPDMILREDRLARDLAWLAEQAGAGAAPPLPEHLDHHAPLLATIYDADLERTAQDALARDYQTFGFASWGQAA